MSNNCPDGMCGADDCTRCRPDNASADYEREYDPLDDVEDEVEP